MEVVSECLKMPPISLVNESLFHSLYTDPAVISLCFDEPSASEIKAKFRSRPVVCTRAHHWANEAWR